MKRVEDEHLPPSPHHPQLKNKKKKKKTKTKREKKEKI
jgi:hypothetical protein